MHSPTDPTSTKHWHFDTLDGLRIAAALEVMLGHAVWLLWQSDSSQPIWNLLEKLAAVIFRYGIQAVVLFFMLSGFLIHLNTARRWVETGESNLDWRRYARSRAKRLYPTLLLALVLTFAVDSLGQAISPALYAGQAGTPFDVVFSRLSLSWWTLLGNLLFMQGIVPAVATFGTNTPLWTLAYEAVYYILYPVVFLPIYRRLGPARAFVFAVAISLIALPLAESAVIVRVLAYYSTWAAGAALADLYASGFRLPGPGWWLSGAAGGILVLMAGYSWPIHPILRDWLWAACFAALILVAVDEQAIRNPLVAFYHRVLNWLAPSAAFSYTLYVAHFPLMTLGAAVWLAQHPTLPRQGWLALIVVLVILAASYGLSLVGERPFLRSRSRA
jgi:peptidoglycan/LPS O-acetylase OafA/YrhL